MLNRREFGLLLGFGAAGLWTTKTFGQTPVPNALDSYFAQAKKIYGLSSKNFSYEEKIFYRNEQCIPVNTERFCFVDYDKHASLRRFFLINKNGTVEMNTLSSHGLSSGNATTFTFSNAENSNQTSLGIYVLGSRYIGQFGPAFNLHGLSPTNSRAYRRRVVMHGADYCSPQHVSKHGFLGRSLGCITTPKAEMAIMYKTLPMGTLVFARSLVSNKAETLIAPTPEEISENGI